MRSRRHHRLREWISAARGPLLMSAALWFLCGWSFFDPFHAHVEKGNHEAKKGKPSGALEHYEAAGKLAPASPIPDFNRGIVYSQEGNVDQARSAFEAAQASEDQGIAADAHYNLGNLLLQKDDAAGAIDQYLRSLDLDPSDPDARRNLEIAVRRKEEQQQQQKNDPSAKDQDKKQQEQDQQKDESGEKKDQEQQKPDQGKKDEKKPPQDPSQQDQQQQQPENPGDKQESPPLRPEEQLSKEDAARLLNAIQNDELKVLRALEEKKGQEGAVGNDW
ncbi:MAG TPA: tetratricopeptide repeat protein [bacterium]|nr:tetratricopeptide repeat protein [bacterium]